MMLSHIESGGPKFEAWDNEDALIINLVMAL